MKNLSVQTVSYFWKADWETLLVRLVKFMSWISRGAKSGFMDNESEYIQDEESAIFQLWESDKSNVPLQQTLV
jgi:hypothetical protein